ncbi:hypothetical protein [Leucobacter sp. NPDC077196]|uniref:hypothetical protein n=1 Tax=Leucobacter sp. NPDC077196 TaxID=3154959 RepID=UPI0034199C12
MSETSFIEVYPVGLLSDIKRKRARNGIKGYLMYQVKRRNWRAVRNYFNGYLAEWHYCPDGVRHTKCGRGWTRRIALRRLGIHIAEANTKGAY